MPECRVDCGSNRVDLTMSLLEAIKAMQRVFQGSPGLKRVPMVDADDIERCVNGPNGFVGCAWD